MPRETHVRRALWVTLAAIAGPGCHSILSYSPGDHSVDRAADVERREWRIRDSSPRDGIRPQETLPNPTDGAPAPMVTTIAGTSTCGQLCGPHELHLASTGTLYIASFFSHRICAIPPPVLVGKIVDFAGTGFPGYKEGDLTTVAQLENPSSVASLDATHLLVADRDNHRIRLLNTSLMITKSYAGTGMAGFKDDAASQAQFSSPSSIAVLGGEVYVVDAGNLRIRKIDAAGAVSTFAGSGVPGVVDGPLASASFAAPHSITYDQTTSAFYVTECSTSVVRKIASGQVTVFAGSTVGHSDGPLLQARFHCPGGIVAHQGVLFIGDYSNQRVRMIKGGQVTTLAGSGKQGHLDGPALSAEFSGPDGVAYDAATGVLYVADHDAPYIRAITGVVP